MNCITEPDSPNALNTSFSIDSEDDEAAKQRQRSFTTDIPSKNTFLKRMDQKQMNKDKTENLPEDIW